jgi:hypothetical protein
MDLHHKHTPAFEAYLEQYRHLDDEARRQFDARFEREFGADFTALWKTWRREPLGQG